MDGTEGDGGGKGGWEAEGGLQQSFVYKLQCSPFSMGPELVHKIHRLGNGCH